MPSPFPGMDPYLESPTHWPDFHSTFINTLRETIADELPGEYFARIQEDLVLLEPEPPDRRIQPDVLLAADRPSYGGGAAVATLVELEPTTVPNYLAIEPRTELYIEIIRLPDSEVVSVIEVLSPTNKNGDGRGIYTEKRNRLLLRTVNLIEIDLLRAGQRIKLALPSPTGDYFAFISRGDRRPACNVYTWGLRRPLPKIPIPLRAGVPDSSADLAQAFALAYERGRYGRVVRYESPPPEPAFTHDDSEWIASVTRAAIQSTSSPTP